MGITCQLERLNVRKYIDDVLKCVENKDIGTTMTNGLIHRVTTWQRKHFESEDPVTSKDAN